jgi:hypothetical protein
MVCVSISIGIIAIFAVAVAGSAGSQRELGDAPGVARRLEVH